MSELDMVIKLLLAAIFSGLVGWERQAEHKPAGLRTHMLVGLGSALFTIISYYGITELGMLAGTVDPTRIAAGIVTGIGFLGAGAILQSKGEIKGLTTAASIWIVSAVGMAVGFGLYFLAGLTSIITLVILFIVDKLEKNINPIGK